MGRSVVNLTKKQKQFVLDNWNTMSNGEMARQLNIKFTTLSGKLHLMGLFRMHFEYWTDEQTEFLKNNYETIGDKELAILFNGLWEKDKRWSGKHIEKKRFYLNLKRTPEQLKAIKIRNRKRGCWKDTTTWDTRGAKPIGDIRIWHYEGKYSYKVIKTDRGYLVYSRWMYEKHFGPIPPGHIVTFRDGDSMNVVPENLYTLPVGGNARKNNWKYPEEIRTLEKALNQLNNTLKQKQ